MIQSKSIQHLNSPILCEAVKSDLYWLGVKMRIEAHKGINILEETLTDKLRHMETMIELKQNRLYLVASGKLAQSR